MFGMSNAKYLAFDTPDDNALRRKCNPMVDFSKFTSNKNILRRVVTKLCSFVGGI